MTEQKNQWSYSAVALAVIDSLPSEFLLLFLFCFLQINFILLNHYILDSFVTVFYSQSNNTEENILEVVNREG